MLTLAIVISVVFVVQFVMQIIGADFDTDFDFDGSATLSDFVSFKGVIHFVFGFAWTWVLFRDQLTLGWTIFLSIVVGLSFMLLMMLLYKLIMRLQQDNEQQSQEVLVNQTGSLYALLEDGLCQVEISHNGRITMVDVMLTDALPLQIDKKEYRGRKVLITEYKNNLLYGRLA